jgi:signal transduction histidine kinase
MTNGESRPGLWRRARNLVTLPVRLFQERTSVQLIVSHVVVVLISVFLIQAAVIAAVLGFVPFGRFAGINDLTIDPYLGERTRAYAQWMDPDRLERVFANGVDDDEAKALDAVLTTITTGNVPGFESTGSADAKRVQYAALVDPAGTVIATSDPGWVASGTTIADFIRGSTQNVARAILQSNGGIQSQTNAYYAMDVLDQRTSAAYPLITTNGKMIGELVIEGGTIGEVLGPSRGSVVRQMTAEYLKEIWIFAIPAILVAVPVGVWRSRSLSRRLRRLEGAASALAAGNLQTRVRVTRVDEIGKLALRFNEMGQHIEATDQSRRAFVSNVSHELRTPVAIIHGATERMIEQQKRNEPIDDNALDVVRRETEMLSRLIDDLFTMTRIEEHNLRLERVELNVASICREAVRSLSDLAWNQRKVRIESLVSADLAHVMADPTRVRQIINNLLYNALRHTPEGGLIVIQGRQLADQVELSISDTGMGIPEEELASVFHRFYQAERTQRSSEGSGLGLNIVQQLVEAHGGGISAESVVGQGTTFRFSLPIAK